MPATFPCDVVGLLPGLRSFVWLFHSALTTFTHTHTDCLLFVDSTRTRSCCAVPVRYPFTLILPQLVTSPVITRSGGTVIPQPACCYFDTHRAAAATFITTYILLAIYLRIAFGDYTFGRCATPPRYLITNAHSPQLPQLPALFTPSC